jgi:hypothetical protein
VIESPSGMIRRTAVDDPASGRLVELELLALELEALELAVWLAWVDVEPLALDPIELLVPEVPLELFTLEARLVAPPDVLLDALEFEVALDPPALEPVPALALPTLDTVLELVDAEPPGLPASVEGVVPQATAKAQAPMSVAHKRTGHRTPVPRRIGFTSVLSSRGGLAHWKIGKA